MMNVGELDQKFFAEASLLKKTTRKEEGHRDPAARLP